MKRLVKLTSLIVLMMLMASSIVFGATINKTALTEHDTDIVIDSFTAGVAFEKSDDNNSTGKLAFEPKIFAGGKYASNTSETLEDYLYTFSKNDNGSYTVKAVNQNIYFGVVKDNGGGTVAGKSTLGELEITVHDGAFTFREDLNTLYFATWNTFNHNKANADANTKMYVYRYNDGIYKQVKSLDELSQDDKYLITVCQKSAKSAYKDNWFAVRPSTAINGADSNRNMHVALIKTTKLTVHGLSTGTTTYTVGDNTYIVDVHDSKGLDGITPEVVDPDNTVFIRKADGKYVTNDYIHNKLSKLLISEGYSFKVDLDPEIKSKVTGILWGSSDSEYLRVTGSADEGATLTAIKPTEKNGVVMLRVGYIVNKGTAEQKTVIKDMPVVIYPASAGGNDNVTNYYIQEGTDSTGYVCFGMEPNAVSGAYMTEIQEYEQIFVDINGASIDFFAKPRNGDYALTYLGHNYDYEDVTPGNFDTLGPDGGFKSTLSYRNQTLLTAEENAAIDKGCQGGFGYTSSEQKLNIRFRSDKLPEISKKPYAIKSGNEVIPIENVNKIQSVRKGDIIYFKITIDTFEAPNQIQYGDNNKGVFLKEALPGAFFVDIDPLTNSTMPDQKEDKLDVTSFLNADYNKTTQKMEGKEHIFYAAYEVQESDVGRAISNTVSLEGNYKAKFSKAARTTRIEVRADKIQVVANSIRPLSNETVKLPENITLPDGGVIKKDAVVEVHQVYFVKAGVEATLDNFAGENNLDCLGAVYEIKDNNGHDATYMFKRTGDETNKSMLYTADADDVYNYIITYEAENLNDEGNSIGTKWMIYAVKIIAKADQFTASSLTVGKTCDMNFFIQKYDRKSVEMDAKTHWLSEANAKIDADTTLSQVQKDAMKAENQSKFDSNHEDVTKGVDFSNFDDELRNYKVAFEVDGEETEPTEYVGTQISTTSTGETKTLYKYTFKGLKAYEMGKVVAARLYHDNDGKLELVDEKTETVASYCDKVEATYRDNKSKQSFVKAMKTMLTYGFYAEEYAIEQGWKDYMDIAMMRRRESVDEVQVTDDSFKAPNTDQNLRIESVRLRFDKGMSIALVTDIKMVNGDSINNWNLQVQSTADLNMSNNGQAATNGVINIPGSRLSRIDEDTYRVTIVGISPFFWKIPYQFKFTNAKDETKTVTMDYSVNSYFDRMTSKDLADKSVQSLLKAMFKFGNAARIWKYGQL